MKVTGIETFVVDGDTRPWLFCAIRTDRGVTGYSEFGDGQLVKGLAGLVDDSSGFVVGKDHGAVEKLHMDMYRAARQAPGGATAMAIAGIELALWDIKGKRAGMGD